MEKPKRIILVDADVVSHFIIAGEVATLCAIFPANPVYILDKVYTELQQWPSSTMRNAVSSLISNEVIQVMDFPEDNDEIKREYYWIKNMQFKGDGESACLAVARFNKNILASSNLRDIKSYCTMHKIDYLTTMDFLCEALRNGLFTADRCNTFIASVLSAGSKLPVKTMTAYQCRSIDFL
jgi:predicted nucleic acid-binding protein